MSDYRVYLTQTIDRHVIKRLDSNSLPATYDGQEYGVYGEVGRLRFPSGVTSNGSYILMCDYKNSRIVRLTLDLDYVDEYDTSATIERPYLIFYDSVTSDFYILGISASNWNCKIQRITINVHNELESVKFSSDYLGKFKDGQMPTGFCRGFGISDLLVCGQDDDLFITTETVNDFTLLTQQHIVHQEPKRFFGMIHHTNDYLYLNDGNKISKVDSTFQHLGNSDFISKTLCGLKQVINDKMMFYNVDSLSLSRVDSNMNFVEDVYNDSGSTIDVDAKYIMDFIELAI